MISRRDQANVRSVKVGKPGPVISRSSFDRSMDLQLHFDLEDTSMDEGMWNPPIIFLLHVFTSDMNLLLG